MTTPESVRHDADPSRGTEINPIVQLTNKETESIETSNNPDIKTLRSKLRLAQPNLISS